MQRWDHPTVGVLALQGATESHLAALAEIGAPAMPVRTPDQLDAVGALIIPGGESTTICKLIDLNELREPLRRRLDEEMPVMGTCAGMIALAREVVDGRPDQVSLDAIDLTVRRNAFGRQVDSFEAELDVEGLDDGPFPAVFIRAPWVERVGPGVTVLADVDDHPVLCRAGSVLVAAFHPELTDDRRLHRFFLERVVQEAVPT